MWEKIHKHLHHTNTQQFIRYCWPATDTLMFKEVDKNWQAWQPTEHLKMGKTLATTTPVYLEQNFKEKLWSSDWKTWYHKVQQRCLQTIGSLNKRQGSLFSKLFFSLSSPKNCLRIQPFWQQRLWQPPNIDKLLIVWLNNGTTAEGVNQKPLEKSSDSINKRGHFLSSKITIFPITPFSYWKLNMAAKGIDCKARPDQRGSVSRRIQIFWC